MNADLLASKVCVIDNGKFTNKLISRYWIHKDGMGR